MDTWFGLARIKETAPFVGMIGGTDPIGGINGIAAAIGGNTPDIDDDVKAAIALAAAAARLYNENDITIKANCDTRLLKPIECSTQLTRLLRFSF